MMVGANTTHRAGAHSPGDHIHTYCARASVHVHAQRIRALSGSRLPVQNKHVLEAVAVLITRGVHAQLVFVHEL